MRTLKRFLASALALVMLVGLSPASILTPAYAATHTQNDGFNFGGNVINVWSAFDWKQDKAAPLQAVSNHLIDGVDAFCIDPTKGPGDSYSSYGDGTTAETEYWKLVPDTDRRNMAGVLKYYYNNPQASYVRNSHDPHTVAKLGAQLALYLITVKPDSSAAIDGVVQNTYWTDARDYAWAALNWTWAQTAPTASVAAPTFDNQVVELTYNDVSGLYEGSVTDTSGALSRDGYNFTQTVNGIQVSQSGNTVTISATPAAATAAGLDSNSNTWSASSTATKSVADELNIAALTVYHAANNKQDMIIYDPSVGDGTVPAEYTATIKAHATLAGYAAVQKSSSDTSLSNENTCYSLSGAVYSIFPTYDDAESGTNAITSVTTDENGTSETAMISAGTYYLKEIIAPMGFALNTEVVPFTVIGGQTTTVQVTDTPISDPVPILLQKIDSETGEPRPAGSLSLAGAQYTIEFYGGQYATAAEAEASGNPTRSWVVKTDEYGYATLADTNYIVSGDELWLASNDDVTFPLGTVVIYESQAPEGYFLDTTHYVVNITEDGTSLPYVSTYNAPQVPEAPYLGTVTVRKTDSETTSAQGNASFAGAKFGLVNENEQSVTINGVETAPGEVALIIETNADGVGTSGKIVPYGTYSLIEVEPPVGYALNSNWSYGPFSITEDGQVINADTCPDNVVRGGVSVQKIDSQLGTAAPYGDASFEGIVFNIYNASTNPVVVNGNTYAVNDFITSMTTNSAGYASTDDNLLPYGTYRITEASTPANSGYGVNTQSSVEVNVTGNGIFAAADYFPNVGNTFGGISVQKIDAARGIASASGDASLEGAVFAITNASANPVVVNGVSYNVGDVVATMTTNRNGVAETGAILPMGTYTVTEQEPSQGYTLNTDWSKTAVIRSNGEVVSFTDENACPETPFYGSIAVQKLSSDGTTNNPRPGMSLAGAEIDIINASANPVVVNNVTCNVGDVVATIITNEAGWAESDPVLPYGTYTLAEKTAPRGYGINYDWNPTVSVRSAQTYVLDGDDSLVDDIARSDVYFIKADGTTQDRLANIPFMVTNTETGEHHVIVTDANGVFSSANLDKSVNTNGNDAAVSNSGEVDESALDSSYSVWFFGDSNRTPRNDKGAFPFGNYTFTELSTSANSMYELVSFTVEITAEGQTVDLGTIDDNPLPHVVTELLDVDTHSHISSPEPNTNLADKVSFFGLRPNKTYEIKGILVDKETGDPILVNGETVTAEVPAFRASTANGFKNIQYVFDASGMAGKAVVSVVSLFEDGVEVFNDYDLSNEDESMYFPSMHTTATSSTGVKELAASPDTVVVDVVSYDKLIPGTTYTLKGRLVDKATGEAPVGSDGVAVNITAEKTFQPESYNGSVEMTFRFDATKLEGTTLVAFEQILRNSVVILRHENVNDEDQTVRLPKVETELVDENHAHVTNATETVTLTDTVTYSGLRDGATYTVNGTLMDKATGDKALDANGNEIHATASFTADSTGAGSVELTFIFNGTNLLGKSVVAFEEVYEDEYLVTSHCEIDDSDQTVSFSGISTVAHVGDDRKETIAMGTVEIIDTVIYEGLVPGLNYTVNGVLMDKASGMPMTDASGNEITGSTSFTPTQSEGRVDVSFTFDATAFAGHTAVAFETLYYGNEIIAEHREIDDAEQAISFPAISTFAHGGNGEKEILASESATIVDTITYTNLIPGNTYTLQGKLINSTTEEVIAQSSVEFVPAEANGSKDVTFTFDATQIEGGKVVVYETLKSNLNLAVAIHEERLSEEQTVRIPEITTELLADNGTHSAPVNASITLTDTVTFKNLTPGVSYTFNGTLMDKATGESVRDAGGNEIVATATFAPETANGTVDLTFTFDSTALAGKSVVAFEEVRNGDYLVAVHQDINDNDQSSSFPEIHTTAYFKNDNQYFFISESKECDGVEQNYIVVEDHVSYSNLIPGQEYTLRGELVDKDTGNSTGFNGVLSFTPTEANGVVTVEIGVTNENAALAGHRLVAYETLSTNFMPIIEHKSLDDEAQTVQFTSISTNLHSTNGSKEIFAEANATVVDTITYKNLTPGKEYLIVSELRNAEGQISTINTSFVPETRDGTVDVSFTFDALSNIGKTVYATEEIRPANSTAYIARHSDAEDLDQTATIPEIHTSLKSESNTHITEAKSAVRVVDTVSYFNLIPNTRYTVTGTLMNRVTGEPVLKNGQPVTASSTFTSPESDHDVAHGGGVSGTIDMVFTFDASDLAGEAVVAFEKLSNEYGVIAVHENLSDDEQTTWLPAISTNAFGTREEKEVFASANTVIRDVVAFAGLIPNQEYVVSGTLMDKSTGEVAVDASGNEITSSVTFTPDSKDGSVNMNFTADMTNLAGHTLVVFETVSYEGNVVARHENLQSESQTVTMPKIWTEARNPAGGQEMLADGTINVVDKVHYENLIPGKTYTVSGKLMDKNTGTQLVDRNGNGIVASATFTPDTSSGSVDVTFTFDASNLKNKTLVVFENLSNDVELVSEHQDLNDREQSIYFPEISTSLVTESNTHVAATAEAITLTDTVTYSNLTVGNSYTVNGKLMDKATGFEVLDTQGNSITATATFVAESESGSVDLVFTFNSNELAGKIVVAFEKLSNEYGVIATHEQIESEAQTAYIPSIRTVLTDDADNKDVYANGAQTLVDKVSYEGLMIDGDNNYKLVATLMDKDSNTPVLDGNGNPVTGETVFSTDSTSGTVNVTISLTDCEAYAGHSLVAFESLYYKDELITEHNSIDDTEQTVVFPSIGTELLTETGNHVSNCYRYDENGTLIAFTLVDHVAYENVIPGNTYTLVGKLINKATGEAVLNTNGSELTSQRTFVPETSSGVVDVTFTIDPEQFNAMAIKGTTVVAFETLVRGDTTEGTPAAEHANINDESQSVHFPVIRTSATAENETHIAAIGHSETTAVITDRVTYTNLIPGISYKVVGTLMNAENGAVIRDTETGEPVTAEAEFIPSESNGTVDVVFSVPTESVLGMKTVVFEDLMLDSELITSHRDLSDEEQSVVFPVVVKGYKYDATEHIGLAGAVFQITDKGLAESGAAVVLLPDQNATSDTNGYFYFNALPGHQYSIVEVTAPTGYLTSSAEYIVNIDSNGNTTNDISIPNVHGGTIVITKTDAITGVPLAGCEISIFKVLENKEQQLVFVQTTDSKGRIYFYTNEPGTYVYRETATIDGYYLNEEDYTFHLEEDSDNERLTVTGETHITNVPFGTVVIKKVNSEGQPLAGAQFAFFTSTGTYLGQGVSDAKGRVYFVSPGPGDYYYTEVKAPEGYTLNTESWYFRIGYDYTVSGSLRLINNRNDSYSKTGDTQNMSLWLGLGLTSLVLAVGCTMFFVFKKRKAKTAAK